MIVQNRKSQFTIFALVGVFVTLLIFSLLYSDIAGFISDTCAVADTTTCDMTEMLPFFVVVALLLTILFYGLPTGG